jgi:hypothetical protein
MVPQTPIRNGLCRSDKTHPAGVQSHVVERRIVNLGVEIVPSIAASRLVLLPDYLGSLGFAEMVGSTR